MQNKKLTLFYITTPNHESSRKIAHSLLAEKLIACANIIKNIDSIFLWGSSIHNSDECVIICKTLPQLKDAVFSTVADIHEYDCPCIVSFEVDTSESFISWVINSLS